MDRARMVHKYSLQIDLCLSFKWVTKMIYLRFTLTKTVASYCLEM